MDQPLTVVIGDNWRPRLLVYFAMAILALMLISNVLNLKFIDVGGVSIIGSQAVYVLSLITADIMAEVYGYRRVRRALYMSLACLVVYAVSLQLVVVAPAAHGFATDREFRTVFAQTPRIAVASVVGYFVTELVNSLVMSRLKVRLAGRFFYGRALLSVGAAQIVNVVTFFGVAFAGVMPLIALVSAGAISWLTVMVCELCVLPITKRLALAVKRYEGVEHYDAAPHVAPSPGASAAAPELDHA